MNVDKVQLNFILYISNVDIDTPIREHRHTSCNLGGKRSDRQEYWEDQWRKQNFSHSEESSFQYMGTNLHPPDRVLCVSNESTGCVGEDRAVVYIELCLFRLVDCVLHCI